MLNLTALEARFRYLSSFGCKAAGGKVPFILTRAPTMMRKNTTHVSSAGTTGRSGTCGD